MTPSPPSSTEDAPFHDRWAAVSVDLDSLACYWSIHALPGEPPASLRHVILRRCLPRFQALFAEMGIPATFFVVGRDLEEDAESRDLLRALAAEGHELASHTHTHPYRFVRLPPDELAAEIDDAHASLLKHTGHAPHGFRAPGYAITDEVLALLESRGYRYDSSVFPSWPYYAAKAAVMTGLRLRGRRSASLLDHPSVLGAPREPYHPAEGQPYRRGGRRLWELPIAVTPLLRFPVIGTSVVMLPAWLRRLAVAHALDGPLFNLELHGIDLADAALDELPEVLVARQPDLRRPLASKRAALAATLAEARAIGRTFATLGNVAAEWERRAS